MKRLIATILALVTLIVPLSLASCSKQNTDSQQPENTLKAENEAVDYYFYYPDDWQLDRNDGMISIKFNTSQSSKIERYASISVTSFNLINQYQNVNDYWNEYKPKLVKIFDNETIELFDEKEITLDGVSAAKKGYKALMNDISYKFVTIICIRYGYVYLITLTAFEEDYNSTVAALDTVISNFHFK